jgi:hypothetical protein
MKVDEWNHPCKRAFVETHENKGIINHHAEAIHQTRGQSWKTQRKVLMENNALTAIVKVV